MTMKKILIVIFLSLFSIFAGICQSDVNIGNGTYTLTFDKPYLNNEGYNNIKFRVAKVYNNKEYRYHLLIQLESTSHPIRTDNNHPIKISLRKGKTITLSDCTVLNVNNDRKLESYISNYKTHNERVTVSSSLGSETFNYSFKTYEPGNGDTHVYETGTNTGWYAYPISEDQIRMIINGEIKKITIANVGYNTFKELWDNPKHEQNYYYTDKSLKGRFDKNSNFGAWMLKSYNSIKNL